MTNAVMAIYPGVLTSTAGLQRVIINDALGFPLAGLKAAYQFGESSGTAVADAMGGPAGLIEHPDASLNAFAHLSGGGVRLDGTEIVTFGAFDAREPFTLISAGSIIGEASGVSGERRTGVIAFRDWPIQETGVRGALCFVRGGENWTGTTTEPYYGIRPANGAGAQGDITVGSPGGATILDQRRLHVLTYDGTSALKFAVYDGAGALVTAAEATITDTVMTTGAGGVVHTALQPIVGGPYSAYNGGSQQVEVFYRYDHVLDATEMAAFASAATALGAARGRAW